MALIVPGKGWCTSLVVTNLAEEFAVLGPLADGDYARRLHWTVTTSADTQCFFGASLGGSNEASVEAYRAGASLIQRGRGEIYGHPYGAVWLGGRRFGMGLVPVGIRGSTGSRYIVVYVHSAVEPCVLDFIIGVDVLRFERERAVGKEG